MEPGCKGETELTRILPGHLKGTVGNNLVKAAGDGVGWQHAQALSQAGCLVPTLLQPSGRYVTSLFACFLIWKMELMKELPNRMGASFCWIIKRLRQFLEHTNNWLMTSIISTTAGSCHYYGSNEEDPDRAYRNRTKLFEIVEEMLKAATKTPRFLLTKTQIFLE